MADSTRPMPDSPQAWLSVEQREKMLEGHSLHCGVRALVASHAEADRREAELRETIEQCQCLLDHDETLGAPLKRRIELLLQQRDEAREQLAAAEKAVWQKSNEVCDWKLKSIVLKEQLSEVSGFANRVYTLFGFGFEGPSPTLSEELGYLESALETTKEQLVALRNSVLNQAGDDACWIPDPEHAQLPPKEEFLKSCERFHAQRTAQDGTLTGCMTIAQLEQQLAELAKPPEDKDWEKLVQLAYSDGGDGALRINRITAEYNRVREQLVAANSRILACADAMEADRKTYEITRGTPPAKLAEQHQYQESHVDPGTCATCGLPWRDQFHIELAKPAEPLRSLPDQERPANYRCEKDGTCPCEGLCRRVIAWRDLTEAERERLMAKPAEPR